MSCTEYIEHNSALGYYLHINSDAYNSVPLYVAVICLCPYITFCFMICYIFNYSLIMFVYAPHDYDGHSVHRTPNHFILIILQWTEYWTSGCCIETLKCCPVRADLNGSSGKMTCVIKRYETPLT